MDVATARVVRLVDQAGMRWVMNGRSSRLRERLTVLAGTWRRLTASWAGSSRTSLPIEVSPNNSKKCPRGESLGTYMPAITGELVLGCGVTGRADHLSGREGPGKPGEHGVVPGIQGGELQPLGERGRGDQV